MSESQAQPQHRTPCSACPFSKAVEPGALGGSTMGAYVGQSCGPFWLPCHSTHDYRQLDARLDKGNAQCAGAAIFRANLGIADRMPAALLALPPGHPAVFVDMPEFVAHHLSMTIREALAWLKVNRPSDLMRAEYDKAVKLAAEGKAFIERVKGNDIPL